MRAALLVAAIALAVACTTPPNPVPANGGSSGSAGAVAPPPAKPPSCEVACAHAANVCLGSLSPCMKLCPGVALNDPGYTPCLMTRTDCHLNCDAAARAAAAKK